MVGLVQLLLKSNASNSLIGDYAACLEARSEESQNVENNNNKNNNDAGILILQVRLHPFHLYVSYLLFCYFI
jgi:nuclear pore complex protein Nup205